MADLRNDSGFSVVEIVVVLMIVAALAAAISPGIVGQLDRSRVVASAESLRSLANVIHDPVRGAGSFRRHVGAHPGTLTQLTRQIGTADQDICGTPYLAAQTESWGGPYLNRIVPAGGIPIGIGLVQDTLVRQPASGGPDPVLTIRVTEVDLADAEALDIEVDGVLNATAGTVLWGAAVDGLVTVEYLIPIKDC